MNAVVEVFAMIGAFATLALIVFLIVKTVKFVDRIHILENDVEDNVRYFDYLKSKINKIECKLDKLEQTNDPD